MESYFPGLDIFPFALVSDWNNRESAIDYQAFDFKGKLVNWPKKNEFGGCRNYRGIILQSKADMISLEA